MTFGSKTVPVRSVRRALGLALMLGAAPFVSSAAFAQAQHAQAQQQQQQRQQRPAQRPAQQQQQQQPQQQQQAQPAAPAPQAAETPPLIYSPWTKVCGSDNQPQQAANAPKKQVCFTIKEARLDTGQFVASAGLIEMDGEQKKILRVTLPLGLLLRNGTRMIVDSNPPMTGVYNFCLPNGCWADFEVTPAFVATLKKGNSLILQAFNLNGQVATFTFPLADFAKSNEGAPTDPKVLEEQQKKLQEELQRRAEEARKKLEEQQKNSPQAQNPPAKK
jgi:invasion protein IalB